MIHLAIGTPMYGGASYPAYNASVAELRRAVAALGGKVGIIALGNESLIQRARNTIAWHFLQSEAKHLLFVDADIGFRAHDVLGMIEADKPVIVAPVPLKMINWERVARAVKDGVPADELYRYSGVFNIVPREGEAREVSAAEAFEIDRGGAALMLIKRVVFDLLEQTTDGYFNDLPGSSLPVDATVKNFFDVYVDDGRLLSEDYGFCHKWRGRGGSVWCAPWCETTHTGTYVFGGVYRDCNRA